MKIRGICTLLTAVGLCVTGCGTGQTRNTSGAIGNSISERNLEGVVIVKDDGTYVHYRQKCDSCGHVSQKVSRFAAPAKGKAIISAFLCAKCGKAQRIVIKSPK